MTSVSAQDYPEEYLGLPGDNLNLYAVMKLFQESETLEGFERKLNDENTRINNLDLNNDNMVDYISVVDYVDGDDHNIVLRVPLDNKEFQDVAVFTVQRFNDGSVSIQLVGDETLYGRNYIIEPVYDDNKAETPNPGYTGRPSIRNNVVVVRTTYYEVASWPLIRFIYLPGYVVWRSSWYWGYYPPYWRPWRPHYWHYYYGYHYNWYGDYYRYYRRWDHYRYPRYNNFYYSNVRVFSPTINIRINEGRYRSTYSHPEQRKQGEALYSRTNRENNNVRRSTASVSTRQARTINDQAGVRSSQTTRQTAERITANPAQAKSGTGTNRIQNNDNRTRTATKATETRIRSSAPAEGTRSSATTVRSQSPAVRQNQNQASGRQASPSVSARSTVKSGQSQETSAVRRSSGNVSQRSSGVQATVRRSEATSRSAKPSQTTAPKGGRTSRTVSKEKSDSKSGNSENIRSSERR